MKPFNLEKALAGNYCVTRNGYKVKVTHYAPEYNTDLIFGFVKYEEYWSGRTWCADGSIDIDGDHGLDIIGMWEDKQPEVTITAPAPLKEAEDKQIVWYIKNDGVVTGHYYKDTNFCIGMLSSGQFFATAKDAQRFADALKGARR